MKEKRQILLTKKVNVGFRKTENHHQNNSAFFFRQVLPMDNKISRQKFEEKQHIWIVFKNLSQDNDQLKSKIVTLSWKNSMEKNSQPRYHD